MSKKLVLIACGLLVLLASITLVSACAPEPEPEYTEPEYAGPIAESILQAANEGDYATYSERFNEEMRSAATEAAFLEVSAILKAKIGEYVSKEFWKVEDEGGFTIVYYKANFTQEPEVTVRVVFEEIAEEVYVAGLWFDSPKLRQ